MFQCINFKDNLCPWMWRYSWLYFILFSYTGTFITTACICVPGQTSQRQLQQHVESEAGFLVSNVSPVHHGNPGTSSAHQNQRTSPHWCRRTHVHQQPAHTHQVPRVKVRHTSKFLKCIPPIKIHRMAGGRMSKPNTVIHLNTSISKALNQQISSTLLIILELSNLNANWLFFP